MLASTGLTASGTSQVSIFRAPIGIGDVRWTPLSRPFLACDKLLSAEVGFGFWFSSLPDKR